ncbi:phosphoribosyltransferase [Streptomyces oceani]|uniref:Phosphoribosyltransferase n=1 Tax=Streptomyces oceani TaxID=1075402 RepID=A0A1E7JVT1_9ACTN|nr:phosphoribosyltransferase family protein [Streptomyces oceani]OEU94812.1 phosphoribosyltransferase [Streptomyces oceani]
MRFRDRRDAGRALVERLTSGHTAERLTDPYVLALPRGGLPVGSEVAAGLHAPLDVLVARKIGAPANPELAVGALAGDAPPLYDQRTLDLLGLTADGLKPRAAHERDELRRREELYRDGRPAPELGGRTVIVVDDGLATGLTARAALRTVRAQEPSRLLLAVPVGSPQAVAALEPEVDELVCPHQPAAFQAVGQWYDAFEQLGDDEVIEILQSSHTAW